MAKFNGHKNWNHWNVSLWINNDEGLYRMAQYFIRNNKTRQDAAKAMHQWFAEENQVDGYMKTPDGAPYSVSSIRAAMVGM